MVCSWYLLLPFFLEAFCLTFSRKSKVLFRSLEWISPLQDRVSIELFSRTVSRKVFSPLQSLTSVFGMGTGGPSAFVTLTSFIQLTNRSLKIEQHNLSEFLKL